MSTSEVPEGSVAAPHRHPRRVARRLLSVSRILAMGSLLVICGVHPVGAAEQEPEPLVKSETRVRQAEVPSAWHVIGFVDAAYLLNFNFPENHLWRSKETTPRTNELAPNMAVAYVQKDATPQSRWGMQFGLQAGYDTKALVPEPIPGRNRPVDGADTLRHFSRANVSYFAPVGKGLLLTAGLFNSYIGYQSIFAKDNLNYTRSYMADNAPYYMFGVSAEYALSEQLFTYFFLINGYNHLSHPNNQFSYGTQVTYKPNSDLSLTETLYYGPDQSSTSLRFWRMFSDSIVSWKRNPWTLALAYDIGTEQAAELPGNPRTFWMGAAFYAQYHLRGPWSVSVRPEMYWDRDGRITGSQQLLRAVTTTLEYRLEPAPQEFIARLEYRYDESTGPGGGFFRNGEVVRGVIGLRPTQHLVLASLIWVLDLDL